jgi:hypothetical protein
MHWITYPLAVLIGLVGCVTDRDPHDPDDDTVEPGPCTR